MLKTTMRALRINFQNPPRQLEAGNPRQADVDNRHVGLVRHEGGKTRLRVARVDDVDVALAGEHRRAAGNDDRMVVNDENAHFPTWLHEFRACWMTGGEH